MRVFAATTGTPASLGARVSPFESYPQQESIAGVDSNLALGILNGLAFSSLVWATIIYLVA